MNPINRGTGSTESERYLATLADRTFLNLWSYPNPYNDRSAGPNKDGKELCDLLVVCGDDVIVFSDKAIRWPDGDDTDLAWSRWYKRAIEHSVKQLRGAERWIKQYPNRVFVDPRCSTPLVAELPPPERVRIHLIAVALGSHAACSAYYGDQDGSLMVSSDIVGCAHVDSKSPTYKPFCIGDVAPEGTFVHVFDETALNLAMREMDTIADFVWYLSDRAEAIRKQKIVMAASEAEMIAYYLLHQRDDGTHLFPEPVTANGDVISISLPPGSYFEYKSSPAAKSKSAADKISYGWDRLITNFSNHILAGTSVPVRGEAPVAADGERALRLMALENRTTRRALAEAFVGALKSSERHAQDRFARVILPQRGAADPESAYVFLVLAFRPELIGGMTYEQYRHVRAGYLETYGDAVLYDNRNIKRVVGIALDASSRVTGHKGGSEDLMLLERLSWTPEAEREVEDRRANMEVLLEGKVERSTGSTHEFPIPFTYEGRRPAGVSTPGGNRHERRKAKSLSGKLRR